MTQVPQTQDVSETKKVTDQQIAALKYLIFQSQDANDWAKRILVFLLDKSEGLKKEVTLTLKARKDGFKDIDIRDATKSLDQMLSGNCYTHLQEIMVAVGTDFILSFNTDSGPTLILYLARESYPTNRSNLSKLEVSEVALRLVDIEESGLYHR